ncbi:hypothetical protein AAMO2058_000551100 [Amorphochlora amoebiformis]
MPSHLGSQRGGSEAEVKEISPTHRLLMGKGYVVHLVGTAHISSSSCSEVKRVIKETKPRAVMVELCDERSMLVMERAPPITDPADAVRRILKGENVFYVLHGYVAASFADKLDIVPGAEFYHARKQALIEHSNFYLVDRSVSVTIARAWGSLTSWEKLKFVYNALGSIFMDMDADEINKLIEELKKNTKSDLFTDAIRQATADFPGLVHAVITERDEYLAMNIRKHAEDELSFLADHKMLGMNRKISFMAVVGAGHLQGISSHWKDINQMETDQLEDELDILDELPIITWETRLVDKSLKWGVLLSLTVTTGAISYGLYRGSRWIISKSIELYLRRSNPEPVMAIA